MSAMAEMTETILEDVPTMEFDWKKTVWNLKLAPKVKMFTWKSLKGIIPVEEIILARHINVDPLCKRCGSLDSINHLLFHCPFARQVWNISPLVACFNMNGLTYLRADWAELQSRKCLLPAGITSTPLTPWIMWSLWKARNKLIFERFVGTPKNTLSQAIAVAWEWEAAQQVEVVRPQIISQPPLPHIDIVARSDAAWVERSLVAGIGWEVESSTIITTGMRGAGFAPSSLVAEGLALRDVMVSCRNLGIRTVRFESDSSQLINAINNERPSLELHCILNDISLLSLEFDWLFLVGSFV